MPAYLIGFIDKKSVPPSIKRIGIFSESSDSITILDGTFPVTICEESYPSNPYNVSYDDLIKYLASKYGTAMYGWTFPYLDQSDKAALNNQIEINNMDEALK